MTTHYQIEFLKATAVLKLSFRSGKFLRLEHLRGKLPDKYLWAIGHIIPPREAEMDKFLKKTPEVIYTKLVKTKTQFSKFNEAWFSFYEDFTGMPPKFSAADGMHLKKIIAHLETVAGSSEEALQMWETILTAWPKLSEFHRENTDLKYINSRLNVLLNAVKKAINSSGTGGTGNSVSL